MELVQGVHPAEGGGASGDGPRPLGFRHRSNNAVTTMANYSRPLMDLLGSLPPGEDVILISHILGGLNIALAMECFPEKVAAGIFVTAFMPDSTSSPSLPIDKVILLLQNSVRTNYVTDDNFMVLQVL